jgi:hypothetical protein
MSVNRLLPSDSETLRVPPLAQGYEEVAPWGFYRKRKIESFFREVNEIPNATLAINVSASAGWISQLAGITNVAVQVASGTAFIEQAGVNKIVATQAYSENNQWISYGQTAQLVSGEPEIYRQDYFSGIVSNANSEAVTLLGNVQQLTTIETVDAASLAQRVVIKEHSLSMQLRRLRKLEDGWDGEKASHISEETCNAAEALIGQLLQVSLSSLAIPSVRLGPLPDGNLRFECTHSSRELFLTISGKVVEVQKWQPLDSVESLGFWETDVRGAREHLEWLVK